jgi:hypothetical protein
MYQTLKTLIFAGFLTVLRTRSHSLTDRPGAREAGIRIRAEGRSGFIRTYS